MTARHSRPQNGDCYHRQEDMGTQTPKAAGSSASPFQADVYPSRPSDAMDIDPVPSWPPPLSCMEESEERQYRQPGMSWHMSHETSARDAHSPPIPPHQRDIPDQLADLLISMLSEHEGQARAAEQAEAFLKANDFPPITKQSLCELDIQSIITNMKLRHDVNFDRDLSFRPNFDGPKGQGKRRTADQYWNALAAELKLYEWMSQGAPLPQGLAHISRQELILHVERRLPKMFATIRDVLRSLVPDRDHARVDEHFDVGMLMQEIERGVCDMVRLAEWIASLLKEHCAPMRDVLVDGMVHSIRQGVTRQNHERPELIVQGLRELLGILEAMKLDIANHQIRNLKPVLIEDTVPFESTHHFDKLCNGPSRVRDKVVQSWYADAVAEFSPQCRPPRRHAATLPLECFTRAAIIPLFSKDSRCDFPDSFHLDYDRLHVLKAEITDLICFEVCTEMFFAIARKFSYHGPIPPITITELRTSISAILGEAAGLGLNQWLANAGPLSDEILRHASRLAGIPQIYAFHCMPRAIDDLRSFLKNRESHHASRIHAFLLPRILDTIDHHALLSPMNLFHALVPTSPGMPAPPTHPSRTLSFDTMSFPHLKCETARLTDLVNRISHILLLHWHVWRPLLYIPCEDVQQKLVQAREMGRPVSAPLAAPLSNRPPPPSGLGQVKQLKMENMEMGIEVADQGQEARIGEGARAPRSQ